MKRADLRRCVPLFALLAAVALPAQAVPPPPPTHVADEAGVLPPDAEGRLDAWLTELEQKTTAQIVVLTIRTTAGRDIRQYALEVAEAWKLGKKGRDNGVLICIAVADRRYAIEVGYGLEGALPDSFCGSLARQHFVPNFRRGDFVTGIISGAVALARRVAEEYDVEISGMPAIRVRQTDRAAGLAAVAFMSILTVLIILALIASARPRRYRYRRRGWGHGGLWEALIWAQILGGGRRSSGRHGGSWSGGSWGGGWSGGSFGGGGGGGFGGGGVSGGW